MDVGVITAVAMLLVWAVWALAFEAPGWVHLLLTLGVALLIYRIVMRGTRLKGREVKETRSEEGGER
jgi:uncharacterized membrane protein